MRDANPEELVFIDGTYFEDIQDYDGNWYKMVKIGEQLWSNQNLKTTRFNNGLAIKHITNGTEWYQYSDSAYCSYGFDPLETYEDNSFYYETISR